VTTGNDEVNVLDNSLLLNKRKYFSLSDLMKEKAFQHFRPANFYKRMKVCSHCFAAYTKIDKARNEHFGDGKQENLDDISLSIIADAEEDQESNDTSDLNLLYLPGNKKNKSKPKYQVSYAFDTSKPLRKRKERLTSPMLSPMFSPLNSVYLMGEDEYDMTRASTPSILLPRIMKNLKTSKLFIPQKDEHIMGLKYHLGHTAHISANKRGERLFATKSSIRMNKLADLGQVSENICLKLRAMSSGMIKTSRDFLKTPNVSEKKSSNAE